MSEPLPEIPKLVKEALMSVLATILLSLAAGTLPAALITGVVTFRLNRAQSTKLLAEAEEVSRDTAINQAKAALEFAENRFKGLQQDYQKVDESCKTCLNRLADTEERLRRSEERMHISDRRLQEYEDRERRMLATLRAIVRVMDDNDPTQVQAAIDAARELI